MNQTITITVNGDAQTVAAGSSLAALLASLDAAPTFSATAVNGVFVARGDREARLLADGDAVFVFQPITGG